MQKRRRPVALDEERDIENSQIELDNPESLLIAQYEQSVQERINHEIIKIVGYGFQDLTELEQVIIILRYLLESGDRCTAQQIADAVGVSRKTYYNRLNEAIQKLRDNLKNKPTLRERIKS